jgi:hypothetical protein
MATAGWDKTLADAKKILGTGAVVPVGKMAGVTKNLAEYNKAGDGFVTLRETLEKKLLELENGASKVKNSLGQAADEITDDDYGLDPKKPDDKKKIDQAQALFKAFFKGKQQDVADMFKTIDDLDKHLIQLGKYKGS